MPPNKWNTIEAMLLLLFAASLFVFYQLSLNAANSKGMPENIFGIGTLRGAFSIAVSRPGVVITTKDFNFLGPGEISAKEIVSGLKLPSSRICLARGEADKRFFMGGSENGFDSLIKYKTGLFGPYNFNVFCYNSQDLTNAIQSQGISGLKPWYFFKCACLKKQGTCCVASLGKP